MSAINAYQALQRARELTQDAMAGDALDDGGGSERWRIADDACHFVVAQYGKELLAAIAAQVDLESGHAIA